MDELTPQDSPELPLPGENPTGLEPPETFAPVDPDEDLLSALESAREPDEFEAPGEAGGATDAADSADAATDEAAGSPRRLARLRRLRPGFQGRPNLRSRRSLAAIGGVTLVVILVAAGLVAGPGIIGSARSSATSSPGADGRSPSLSPVASRSPGSSGPVATGSSGPTESAIPLPSSAMPVATVTFRALVVDSAVDPNRIARAFIFTSDGPGVVSVQVVTSAPTDSTSLCLTMDDAAPVCTTGVTPGIPQAIPRFAHTRWTVTLISANESAPTVDLAISWPTEKPSVTVVSGRFQGAPNPDSLRSLTAEFRPRKAGKATLEASWAPGTFAATVTLTEVSASQPTVLGTVEYPQAAALSPSYAADVQGDRTYQLSLFNAGTDVAAASRPSLTATIAFP